MMERVNNYHIQASQAKARFLTYDQQKLIRKFGLDFDDQYIYVNLLCKRYRIQRTTGNMEFQAGESWNSGNSYNEVMTLLDLLCDSRDDRRCTGKLSSMASFGRIFYRSSYDDKPDPTAQWIQENLEPFRGACSRLGRPIPGGDFGYAFELFDGLQMGLHFWEGDDEFAPRLRFLWDENALQYLRFETMHMATDLLIKFIKEKM